MSEFVISKVSVIRKIWGFSLFKCSIKLLVFPFIPRAFEYMIFHRWGLWLLFPSRRSLECDVKFEIIWSLSISSYATGGASCCAPRCASLCASCWASRWVAMSEICTMWASESLPMLFGEYRLFLIALHSVLTPISFKWNPFMRFPRSSPVLWSRNAFVPLEGR